LQIELFPNKLRM